MGKGMERAKGKGTERKGKEKREREKGGASE